MPKIKTHSRREKRDFPLTKNGKFKRGSRWQAPPATTAMATPSKLTAPPPQRQASQKPASAAQLKRLLPYK